MPHRRLARRRGADPARTLAYRVLREVTSEDAYANLATARALAEARRRRPDLGAVLDVLEPVLADGAAAPPRSRKPSEDRVTWDRLAKGASVRPGSMAKA